MLKAHHDGSTFGGIDVEKAHGVVAPSAFQSQNIENMEVRSAFEGVDVKTFCTPLWREAGFQVKMLRTQGIRSTFGRPDRLDRSERSDRQKAS